MLLKIERTVLCKTSSRKDFQIHISELGKYHGEDVYQAFLTLKEKGYFSLVDSAVGYSNFSYVLTPKGKYYKEHLRLEFLKNILIPFIVALVTATATYHLEKVADEYAYHSSAQSEYELDNSLD